MGLAVGAILPAVALGVLSLLSALDSSSEPATSPTAAASEAERRAFLEYEEAVERAVQDGGFVVTQGMQPGVADIADGAYDDETLIGMARGWTGSMERVRDELAAVEPPAFLVEVASRYDAALAAYVGVGEALVAAAEATGEERAALIEEVPPLGDRADELWERARGELDRRRDRLGLAPKGEGR